MVYYWVVIILGISASIFTYSIDYTFVSGCFVGAGSARSRHGASSICIPTCSSIGNARQPAALG
jgi:allantoicase